MNTSSITVGAAPYLWHHVGACIQAAAQAKGWDHPALAQHLDLVLARSVSAPTLEAITRGRLRPTPALIEALAHVLDLSTADLRRLFDQPPDS
jgi:ribosome-binding protein aMBF1 (putative translation factor)